MLLVLLAHAVVAVSAPLVGRRLGARSVWWAALAPAIAFAWLLVEAPQVLDGDVVVSRASWLPALGLEITLRLDGFALLVGLLVAGIGVLVVLYTGSYVEDAAQVGKLAGLLVAFAGSMLGLVLADNLYLLFMFWELTSVTSFLLIGFEHQKGAARGAALQALLVTGAGGLALLGGFVLLGQAADTSSLARLLESAPHGATVTAGLVLVIVGAATKSAQFPFHFWLPAAMVAPAPVSAYLHSATMVTAGIILVARFAPTFADHAVWLPVVMSIGVVTMVLGGVRALHQHDLKLLLAFSTISQLGLLFVLFGAGTGVLTLAGCVILLAHALYKAALFMVVGIVDRQAGTRDLRVLTGLGRRAPALAVVAVAAGVAMAGLPPSLAFIGKELGLEGFLDGSFDGAALVVGASVLTAALGFAAAGKFLWGAFAVKPRSMGADSVGDSVPRPSWGFLAPPAILGGFGLLLGIVPGVVASLFTAATRSLAAGGADKSLVLWPGLKPALALSVLGFVGGIGVVLARRRLARAAAHIGRPRSAERAYAATIRGLNVVADRVASIIQSGSLPRYLTVVLVTLLALPGIALVTQTSVPSGIVFADSVVQVAVAVLVVGAAAIAMRSRRRFGAVVALGSVGYGVAALYALQGAPDVALAQILVETVGIVVFVLVLRHLPRDFPASRRRVGRVVVATGVGVLVAMTLLIAGGARSTDPVSREYLERAELEADGSNVVNVILVDFRGFDTLGEITVLGVAALGVAGLVAAGRRRLGGASDLGDDGGPASTIESVGGSRAR